MSNLPALINIIQPNQNLSAAETMSLGLERAKDAVQVAFDSVTGNDRTAESMLHIALNQLQQMELLADEMVRSE